MWSRDLCIPRSIASSKKVGSRRVGTYTKPDAKRSFTSSHALDENSWRQRKRAGIGSSSPSPKSDKPHKNLATKSTKGIQKRDLIDEVVEYSSRPVTGSAATRNCYQRHRPRDASSSRVAGGGEHTVGNVSGRST